MRETLDLSRVSYYNAREYINHFWLFYKTSLWTKRPGNKEKTLTKTVGHIGT